MKSNHNSALTFDPKTIIKVESTKGKNKRYEVESLAYVKKNGKMIFSCNAKDKNGNGCDFVGEIIN